MPELPTGTVTFLFTDIEGSTRLLQRAGDVGYRSLLAAHDDMIRDAVGFEGGTVVQTEGDGLFAVFPTAPGAVRAAVEAQRSLSIHRWPDPDGVSVRMGLHTGEGVLGGDSYIGLDVHRAARIAAAGHGGQVLLSDTTRALANHALPAGVAIRDLGTHRLRNVEQPERIHQLVIDGLPETFPAIRTVDARLSNLPPERTTFVGRQSEMAELRSLLAGTRLLTLTGPGGIGKTRLALRVAADQIGGFADGVYVSDLSAIRDPKLVPAAIAGSLVVREETGRDVIDTLADHLRERELLLVLDNVEQVVAAAPSIGRLLDTAPRLSILATSRVPLHIAWEREFPVQPLDAPDPVLSSDPQSLASNEAVTLFIQRAAAVRPGIRLSGDDLRTVARIAVRLDGLPLAIELAASRVKLLAPGDILARLDRRLDLLTSGASDLPERQRTLRATLEWSHELLDGEQQRLFSRLAVFRGGWTLEAAELVAGAGLGAPVLDVLAVLVDHSLARIADGKAGTRYVMLETIREYASERLVSSGEADDTRRRHAEYFRDMAEAAEPHLTRADRGLWMGRLEADDDNLRAALDWTERTGDTEAGLRTASAIWRFWQQRGHLSEGRTRLERLLAMPGSASRDRLRVRALGALGGIAYWQNDRLATQAAYEEAAEIARELAEPRLLASALLDLSFIPMMGQDADRAEAILREGLAAAEDAGDRLLAAEIWDSIAFLEVVRGDPAKAIPLRHRALHIIREEGDAWKVANALVGLAMMSRMAGDLDAAKEHLDEAMAMFEDAGDGMGIAMVLTGLALLANDRGMPGRAARLVGASARIRDELGGGIPPPLMGRWGDPASDARTILGDGAYDAGRAEGYAMDARSAVAYARGSGPTTGGALDPDDPAR